MVQVIQHLPSVLALQVHLSLLAAHQDPEVQQNQQLQLGHFHHENQDFHEIQEGQLNLWDQVHPFLQWDLQGLEDPGDLEDPWLHHFQLSLQNLYLLDHLYHLLDQEFLQFLFLLAYLEDLVGQYLQGSQLVLDYLLDHQDHVRQPFPSHQGVQLFLGLLFLLDCLVLL